MTTTIHESDGATMVNSSPKKIQRAYFFSEVAYDAHHFNPGAYENLLKFVEQDPDEVMVVVDGALTRLDRPELLNGLLTYWDKSERECRAVSDLIPNYEHSQKMFEVQFGILEERMAELRKRLPNAHLVLCVNNDDTQFALSKLLLDLLIHRKAVVKMAIENKRGEKQRVAAEHKKAKKELEEHKKVAAEFKRKKQDGAIVKEGKAKRANVNIQIKELKKVQAEIVAKNQELSLYREQKIRPTHQFVTHTLVEKFIQMCRAICKKYNIKYIDRPRVLMFGKAADDFRIKYAHSGHKTWLPVLKRDEALVRSVLANQRKYNNLIKNVAGQAEAERVDAFVESGHHGIGFATWQKLKDHPEETNFKGNSSYDPVIAEQRDHVKICLAIPFEDQELIARFTDNQEQVRLSFGKPIGSRSHEVFRRFHNDSVSGMFMLTRGEDGLQWSRYIQYQDFKDGSVLKQPERYWAVWASSDEHLGSPEENPMVRDGLLAMFKDNAGKPFKFYGKPAQLAGFISGGDTAEATTTRWDRRYDDRRDPAELLQENLARFARLNPDNAEEVLALAIEKVSDTMSGYPVSMRVMLERVARYYRSFLETTLAISPLQFAHVSVTGNHADGVLRQIGLRESDFFMTEMKARGIGVYEVGISDHGRINSKIGARVGLGGHGDARIIHITDYGLDVKGKPLFGPISLLIQHDPEGPGTSGLVGAGRKEDADVSLAGHIHENWVRLYRVGPNQFSVAYRFSTVQGVTMTEKKYAGSPPRTQAAHCMIMVKPGDFAEKALPAAYLRKVGFERNLQKAEAEIAKAKKK